ncbi:alanine:cation symporter family protein [Deinococcus radiophilus]|uniref:alanine:cation symporter family protein n=1 Tax=Deinococcus radiophilus TaxID=32062 RepID=UPI00361699B5
MQKKLNNSPHAGFPWPPGLAGHLTLPLAGLALAGQASAAATAGGPIGIDEQINNVLSPISNAIASVIFYSVPVAGTSLPLIVVWLLTAAIFFTLYLGFINFRGFKHGIDLVRGRYSSTFEDSPGQITHFQALTTAVSSTVGLGNIAGVAVAIGLGGPGATFWMILAGLLGMATKFTECTLGVKYRTERPDGTVSGGPMYYLKGVWPSAVWWAWAVRWR